MTTTTSPTTSMPRAAPRPVALSTFLAFGLVLALQGCSLVTWAFGESRTAAPREAAPTPASPLPTPTAGSAAAGEARPGGTVAAAPTDNPTTASSPMPSGAPAPLAMPAPTAPAPATGAGAAVPPAPAPASSPRTAAGRPAAGTAGAAAAPSALAPTAVAGRYAVQFAAFRNAASAQVLREQLAAELSRLPEMAALLASLRVVEHAGLHRVWVGDADTAAEAAALARRLRAATGRDVFVTRP